SENSANSPARSQETQRSIRKLRRWIHGRKVEVVSSIGITIPTVLAAAFRNAPGTVKRGRTRPVIDAVRPRVICQEGRTRPALDRDQQSVIASSPAVSHLIDRTVILPLSRVLEGQFATLDRIACRGT